MPFLGNQYNCEFLQHVHTVCIAWGKNRERRSVCSWRITILLKHRRGGKEHTAAVLQWMNKSTLGVAGEGGKGEWNRESKGLPGIESGRYEMQPEMIF